MRTTGPCAPVPSLLLALQTALRHRLLAVIDIRPVVLRHGFLDLPEQARRALELAVSVKEGLLQGLARAAGIVTSGARRASAPECEDGPPHWVGVRVQRGGRVEGDHVEVRRISQSRLRGTTPALRRPRRSGDGRGHAGGGPGRRARGGAPAGHLTAALPRPPPTRTSGPRAAAARDEAARGRDGDRVRRRGSRRRARPAPFSARSLALHGSAVRRQAAVFAFDESGSSTAQARGEPAAFLAGFFKTPSRGRSARELRRTPRPRRSGRSFRVAARALRARQRSPAQRCSAASRRDSAGEQRGDS
jgi:hypothetical protein